MHTTAFTTESIPKLFFHYLIPSICGTMVTSIYVLADTIIIGKGIGTEAMAALNIVLPVFSLFFGTGLLFGVGGSVLMSIARGKKDTELGESHFTMSLILNILTCILLMVIFLNFQEPIARFLGMTEVTKPYVMDYLPYITWGMGAFFFSSFFQTFVRNDGAPRLSMAAVISGGVLNVILDCLFVFTFDMGMKGAAIASVIGAVTTVCILLTHFLSEKNGLHLRFQQFGLKSAVSVIENGIASFLIEMTSGIVMFFFNIQLLHYIGDIGVSVYGIIANTAIIVFCLCNGINQAGQPIISTNYGAGLLDRTNEVKRLAIKTALIICAVPALLGLAVPNLFTYIFLHPDEQVLTLAPTAIRIYFTAFFVTGVNMFIISYFQATTKAAYSLLLCLLRGCILSVLFVYVLPPVIGISGIWASVPLAELLTLAVSVLLLRKTSNKEVSA